MAEITREERDLLRQVKPDASPVIRLLDALDAAEALDTQRLKQIGLLQEIIRNDTTPSGVEVARYRADVASAIARAEAAEAREAKLREDVKAFADTFKDADVHDRIYFTGNDKFKALRDALAQGGGA